MNPIPSVSNIYAQDGSSTRSNALGMRPMQELAYQKRGEQYLLIKSPPASGKSRARQVQDRATRTRHAQEEPVRGRQQIP